MRTSWEAAKASQDADNIRTALLTNDFVPPDINQVFTLFFSGKAQTVSLVDLLLSKPDSECLCAANRLLQMGARLPVQSITMNTRNEDQNIASYFFSLL